MAQYNEILEGGLNQVIVKRLGMQTGTAVPAVQPEMTMDLTLESDRPEWGYLKGEFRYGSALFLAAPGAGSHAGVGVENNGTSGLLVTIEGIVASAQCRVALATSVSGFVGAARGRVRDTRQVGQGLFFNEYSTLTANLPTVCGWIPASTFMELAFVLSPGWYFALHTADPATALRAAIYWRERPVLSGELG